MTFDSLHYAGFLAVVLPLYFALRTRGQNVLLLAASYVFYGWWDWRFLSLVALSTLVDFAVAKRVHVANGPARTAWLWVSIATNLGLLGVFKYFGFFADSFAAAAGALGWEPGLVTLQIVLPVGISFYTFQTLAYTIDVHRKRIEPTSDLLAFALYVSFFPQLVAGPIERAERLLPQLTSPRRVELEDLRVGATLIVLGLLRKVGIADAVAGSVDRIFSDPASHSQLELLLGLYLFALQIYGDFAGYSSIARGSARLLGIRLMRNFDQPYLSTHISEFWRRWHRSLSFWLRDYLYIPLGGNRHGTWRTYRNLFLTMLLGGLWHGAAWTFVVWGALHGTYLAIHRAWRGDARKEAGQHGWIARLTGGFLTFHLVVFAWLFFRAPTFAAAWTYLAALLLGPFTIGPELELLWRFGVYGSVAVLLDVVQARARSHTPMLGWSRPARIGALAAGLIFLLAFGALDADVPFIYFQF